MPYDLNEDVVTYIPTKDAEHGHPGIAFEKYCYENFPLEKLKERLIDSTNTETGLICDMKSTTVKMTSGRDGRFVLKRKQDQRLVDEGGEYLLGLRHQIDERQWQIVDCQRIAARDLHDICKISDDDWAPRSYKGYEWEELCVPWTKFDFLNGDKCDD
ncbi:hypothetical protein ACLI4R_10705 [Natrialbaceae archaeon A-chndr2]